ncbi:MAG: hypothetical protein MMC33_003822 [Icmadophila ericetorum]|nr:hypothetical protein [Icmadophila ericetorum]
MAVFLAQDEDVPTPRAVQERLSRIRQSSKSSGAAHLSISVVNTGRSSKPSTPRKPEVKVEKDDASTAPKIQASKAKGNGTGKKRSSISSDDSETEGISLADLDDIFESPSARVKRTKRATTRNSSYKYLLDDTDSEVDTPGDDEDGEGESDFGAEAGEEADEEVDEEDDAHFDNLPTGQGVKTKKEKQSTMPSALMEEEFI